MNAQKIVVATPDRLGTRMAGPAIRACRIARALASAGHDVSLVSTSPTSEVIALDGVDVLVVPPRIEGFDVAVIQGRILVDHPELGKSSTRLVMDLYDPFHLEVMHLGNEHQLLRSDHVEGALQTLSDQIARGDFFMCASERQRDMWLGYLAAGGRINPAIHDLDPTFRSLIDVVPFGVDDGLAQRDGTPLRDAHGFSSDDVVVGWTGGLHHWLDPMLVLDAFAIASVRCPRLKAVFLGGAHPGTGMLSPRAQAIADSVDERGLGDVVKMHREWVTYDQRGPVFAELSIGAAAHQAHLETHFSFRTRLLDHMWAGVPTVGTTGDSLTDELVARGAAVAVEPGDAQGFADVLCELANDPVRLEAMRQAAYDAADDHRWADMLTPLVRYVSTATAAPDLTDPTFSRWIRRRQPAHRSKVMHYVERARRHIELDGVSGLMRGLRGLVRRAMHR